MRLLTVVDQLFLQFENREQPMHIGGLFLFELPADASDSFVSDLVQQMLKNKTPPSFPFNQVLHHLIYWQTEEHFEVEHHFRHIALPKPARIRELLTYVSQEHSKLLNRAKPMWECHVIEGIEGNRFALYFKIHHSMVDGVAAIRLVKKSLSKSPTERMSLPIWSLMTRHRHQVDALIPEDKSWLAIAKQQLTALPSVATSVTKNLFKNAYERFNPNYISTTQAPDSILNQPVSSSRRISVQSYELARFQAIAKQFEVTLNDIVLAVCSGALRRYLLYLDALPQKPLIGFVPLSLREDESSVGNQITFILANLATDVVDPLQRLQTINASTVNSKQRFARMNQSASLVYSGLAYSRSALQIATGLFPDYRGFNLIISNVPGSREPLYWHGAKLEALYPASIVMNDQAMNITLCTYVDKIEFCIVACSQVLPHSQRILDYLEDELQVLENLG
ncbi:MULTISPECIES: WS/DGAT/MGAT family O-acyltransferase [unclassified Moraxella]|uniref:WS/DGAT/MGAT family O-acyltransferase n=1 Tax=unclassified Moraxella TaxID=2685852 RepID=UPI003AF49210